MQVHYDCEKKTSLVRSGAQSPTDDALTESLEIQHNVLHPRCAAFREGCHNEIAVMSLVSVDKEAFALFVL